jgi:hypothetical protein
LQKCFLLNDRIYHSGAVLFAQPIVLCQVSRGLFDSIVDFSNDQIIIDFLKCAIPSEIKPKIALGSSRANWEPVMKFLST